MFMLLFTRIPQNDVLTPPPGWIIHAAGEAEASGPGPRKRPERARTVGPEISREKICGLLD